jgi:hypothetical protein
VLNQKGNDRQKSFGATYYGKPGESNYLIEFTNEIWKQQVKKGKTITPYLGPAGK